MEKTIVKIIWAILFLVCGGMGLTPEPTGAVSVLMVVLGVLFFLPPVYLLVKGWMDKDRKTLGFLRLTSILSLSVSFVLMIANFLCVLAPEWVGNLLYWTLAVVGTPMACLQNPYVSLFLWAALLFASLEGLKESKK